MRLHRSLFATVAVLAIAATGCSDDEGLSSEEQEYADAWAVTLEDDTDGPGATEEEAACMGEAIMTELGSKPFEDADVSPDDITTDEDSNSPGEVLGAGVVTDAQVDAILDTWEDCADLEDLIAQSGAEELELDEQGQQCLADGLAEDGLSRDLLAASFTTADESPDPEILSAVSALVDTCSGGATGSSIADSIATELAADGSMSQEDAQCVADGVVDAMGVERLIEVTAGGSFEDATPEAQQELSSALIAAADSCGVSTSALGG